MKLEKGIYVRTKKGIGKVIYINDFENYAQTDKDELFGLERVWLKRVSEFPIYEICDDGFVLENPSFDIIDLVKEGDYVNGERINFITNKRELLTDGGYNILKKYNSITSIVTKEQFESIKYEVK